MKKSHIIAIVIIAACIALIIATAGDASTYVSFDQAYQMASTGNNTQIHVVGDLKKDVQGNILGIEKSPDNLSFSFIRGRRCRNGWSAWRACRKTQGSESDDA